MGELLRYSVVIRVRKYIVLMMKHVQMYSDREAMKRQSTVLLATAASDTRLTQALVQIEQLTNELEAVKQDSKEKVRAICIISLSLSLSPVSYTHLTLPTKRIV